MERKRRAIDTYQRATQLRFEVDSEGLNSDEDQLLVRPSFWWRDSSGNYKEAELYYDITNKNQYNVKICDDTDKDNNTNYTKLTIDPTLKYFENNKQDALLKSGRKSTASDVNNTWIFAYSLHPKVKAFLKGQDPKASAPLTGIILVNFKIIAKRVDYDKDKNKLVTNYHYTVNEPSWGASGSLNLLDAGKTSSGRTDIDSITGDGHGFVLFYNLDWSALDDYSTQQRW